MVTGERLVVTFYSTALKHSNVLKFDAAEVQFLKAALVSEQVHEQLFEKAGGKALLSTFSFPKGMATFTDRKAFIETQQQLEAALNSAYLVAVRELASQNQIDLAQIAAQIASVESEHRTMGRVIGGMVPANNWAIAPILFGSVADIPAVMQQAGYISPAHDNSFIYEPVSVEDPNVQYRSFFAITCS
jgi:hypothetical protein